MLYCVYELGWDLPDAREDQMIACVEENKKQFVINLIEQLKQEKEPLLNIEGEEEVEKLDELISRLEELRDNDDVEETNLKRIKFEVGSLSLRILCAAPFPEVLRGFKKIAFEFFMLDEDDYDFEDMDKEEIEEDEEYYLVWRIKHLKSKMSEEDFSDLFKLMCERETSAF